MLSLDDAKNEALIALNAFLKEKQPDFYKDRELVGLAQKAAMALDAPLGFVPAKIYGRAGLAHLAYFGPRAIVATASALKMLGKEILAEPLPRSAVDIGAGTGGASLLLAKLGVSQLMLTDNDANALHLAERLLNFCSPETQIRTLVRDLRGERLPKGEWVIVNSSFSELHREDEPESDEEKNRFTQWMTLAEVCDRIFFIEDGDVLRARRLMRLRKLALEESIGVRSPCVHQEACPALENEKEGCHFRVENDLPQELAAFENRVGRKQEKIKISTLVLEKEMMSHAKKTLRVLGEPQKEKGRTRLLVCGEKGVSSLQVLKRQKVMTKKVQKMSSGDVISWPASAEIRGSVLHLQDD